VDRGGKKNLIEGVVRLIGKVAKNKANHIEPYLGRGGKHCIMVLSIFLGINRHKDPLNGVARLNETALPKGTTISKGVRRNH
jgi:hypothetical protein